MSNVYSFLNSLSRCEIRSQSFTQESTVSAISSWEGQFHLIPHDESLPNTPSIVNELLYEKKIFILHTLNHNKIEIIYLIFPNIIE